MALPTLAGNHGFCRGKAAGSCMGLICDEPAALPLHCDSRLIRESQIYLIKIMCLTHSLVVCASKNSTQLSIGRIFGKHKTPAGRLGVL